MDKTEVWVFKILFLSLAFCSGLVMQSWLATDQQESNEAITNTFIEALERENCQVARLSIWQLEVKNLSANETVLVNTDNIWAGNITFMSSNGVNSIKIPGGNYPYLDAVRAMRQAIQTN